MEVIPGDCLPAELKQPWKRIQASSATLWHPMLAAAFFECVARHREDVRIAVLRSGDGVLGFFPFQRDRGGAGRPVGHRLNDWQAGLFVQDAEIDARWLLRCCGLSTWHFDHLAGSQPCFAAGCFRYENSPYIDLSQGLAAYLGASQSLGASQRKSRWKNVRRNVRKLERDTGPVRFEFHTVDRDALGWLIAWKSQQIALLGKRCVFDMKWVRGVLDDVVDLDDDDCSGTLSTLYAGERLVAVHLGLRSQQVLHWWITAYNPEFKSYSPGRLLLVRLIEESAQRGLQRLDLGKGSEPYKQDFQSGATLLASGALCRSPLNFWVQRASYALKQRLSESRVALPAKRLMYWWEKRA